MVGKFLIKLGEWFNRHFPEKVTADEVYQKLTAIELRLHDVTMVENAVEQRRLDHQALSAQVADLAKKVEVLTSENSALKAASALRTKIASSIPMPGR